MDNILSVIMMNPDVLCTVIAVFAGLWGFGIFVLVQGVRAEAAGCSIVQLTQGEMKKSAESMQKAGEKIGKMIHDVGKQVSVELAERERLRRMQARPRHVFTEELWAAFDGIVSDYGYKRLLIDPYTGSGYLPLPSHLIVTIPMQHTPTDAVAEELMGHLSAAFQQYCDAYGLSLPYFALYTISGQYVVVAIYYAEYPDEIAYLERRKAEVVKLYGDGDGHGVLTETLAPPRSKTAIRIGYSAVAWAKLKQKRPIYWDYMDSSNVHACLSGPNGSGKTILAQLIVMQLLEQGADVTICDFKCGGDWRDVVPTYAEGDGCDAMFNQFYEGFVATKESGKAADVPTFLVFDEVATFVALKKGQDLKEFMGRLTQIALMGRSFNYHLILISQQMTSQVIDTAIREQLRLKIHMGQEISPQSAQMLFPGVEIDTSKRLPRFCGYISTPEKALDILLLPAIKNPDTLRECLRDLGHKQQKE